jgi:peptidylprolyl isomerase
MPRGTGPLGFYETPQERTTIRSVRLGSELPASEQVNLEALRTDSGTFRDVIESRRFRRESWFLDPVGHINLCNVPLPVRVRS